MYKQNRSKSMPSPPAETFSHPARIFKALSHPARVRLTHRLLQGECCVSEAEACLGLSQPNVSQHLKILKNAGIIVGNRRGTKICYRLADLRIERVLKIFMIEEIPHEDRRRNQ